MEDNLFLRTYQKLIGQKITQSPSKAGNWLEGTLLEANYGNLTMEYEVREEMCNPGHILHGGMASLMLDDVIGAANYIIGSEFLMTSINLNVDFISSAKVGEKLRVNAELVRKGRNVNNWKAEILNSDGKIVATASSNLITTQVRISDLGRGSSQ